MLSKIRTLCEAETQDSVVKFYGAFYTPEKSQISIVLEYMDAGSLADFIEKTGGVREDVLGKVAEQVLDALSYMHTSQHAMHRDIKPGNILLNYQGETKVCIDALPLFVTPTWQYIYVFTFVFARRSTTLGRIR